MNKKYLRFRVFLMMLALGMAAVPFFIDLRHRIMIALIDVPHVNSNNLLIVSPMYRDEMNYGGGSSGPHGPDEPRETINTLGGSARPYIVENADVQRIGLEDADLSSIRISNSDFSGANLQKANLSKASIDYSSFIGANLRKTNLREARIFGSDLTDADFSGAKMLRANLAHSDLSDAILKNVDLTDANLSDTDLKTAKGLTYQQISRALINKYTSLPIKMESKRKFLLSRSVQRMKELRKEMSAEELEMFTNEFDFLEESDNSSETDVLKLFLYK